MNASRRRVGDELGRALPGLERDIAGEAVGDDHVDPVGGDVPALDEADIVELGALGLRRDALGRLLELGAALVLLGADVEQARRAAASGRGRCGHRMRP